jgi:type VI protein secretion system component Hcp
MAGEIDAFLYFGHACKGGKPNQIDGETGDVIERQEENGYGKSMAIQGYTLGFALNQDESEETKGDDGGISHDHEPQIQDITVTKLIDAASPVLLQALWNATKYEVAWIAQRKAGGVQGRSGGYFWQLRLDTVVIKNLTWAADSSGQITETVTLHCIDGMQAFYYKQSHKGVMDEHAVPWGIAQIKRTNVKSKDNDRPKLDATQTRSLVSDVIKQIRANNPHLNIKG